MLAIRKRAAPAMFCLTVVLFNLFLSNRYCRGPEDESALVKPHSQT
jgi:hypothetical protein